MRRAVLVSTLALVGCALGAAPARATSLIFEPDSGSFANFGVLPQGYGDRVVAASQDGFAYSLSGGVTPNVVTDYGNGALPTIYTWDTDYGDLRHVIFAQEPQVFQFRLVADAGYQVTLNSFDMASWPNVDYTIDRVSVVDGDGNILYNQNNVLSQGDFVGPRHTSFLFSGLTASVLEIQFDSRNMGDSDDVGIDNINFSQSSSSVPEPATLTTLGIGLLTLARSIRRRAVRPAR